MFGIVHIKVFETDSFSRINSGFRVPDIRVVASTKDTVILFTIAIRIEWRTLFLEDVLISVIRNTIISITASSETIT